MQVAVLLISCIGCSYDVLVYCGEVVEDAVGVDTGSIVLTVTVVAGTEGCVGGYQVVTGLHALYGLVHVTCFLPCLGTIVGRAGIVLSLAQAGQPAAGPVLFLLAEVVVGNHAADIGTGSIVLGDGIGQPLDNALLLGLDFRGGSGVVLLDVLIGSQRILVALLVQLGEVVLEGFAE